jgi:cyclomaltodextrinase / maltogenic alpha-amylase / neopullulanase
MAPVARLSRFALLISLAAACAPSGPRASSSETHVAARTTSFLDLEAADADVWAWEVLVAGRRIGQATIERCTVVVNGTPRPAEVAGERFSARVPLPPGVSTVAASCATDRGELRSTSVRYDVRLIDRPKARARATLDGGKLVLDGTASRPGEYAGAPLARWQWTSRTDLVRAPERPVGEEATTTIPAPAPDGEHRYRLRVTDAQGQTDEAGVVVSVIQGGAAIRAESEGPAFLEDAIVYGIVPPLHGEPPLRAAAGALDSIAALGATAVWLPPLFGTVPGDFGYAVTDYEHVRADYGTAEDLRAFVAAAHGQNLRVILDFVPNHTSKEHPYFRQTGTLGSRSHYFGFYERDAQGQATHYFDWKHLPNLGYGSPEVRRWMTEMASDWVRAFGVDGYRVDAAWGVARRHPPFWPAWSAELRRIDPELVLLAEASAREPYYPSHGFDAAYDWTEELGQWAWKDVFTSKAGIAQRLHDAVLRTAETATRVDRVLRFLNNNDTGARFISRYGEEMTRVATAALLTLPGIPCLYDFDEVGGEFEPYAGLTPVRPTPRPLLRDWHEKLIRLRRATPALRGRGFSPLLVDAEREVYAYVRQGSRPDELALVVLHFGALPVPLHLALPERFAALRGGALRDLLTRRTFTTRGGKLDLTLTGWETLILATPREGKNPRSVYERETRNSRSVASNGRAAPSR